MDLYGPTGIVRPNATVGVGTYYSFVFRPGRRRHGCPPASAPCGRNTRKPRGRFTQENRQSISMPGGDNLLVWWLQWTTAAVAFAGGHVVLPGATAMAAAADPGPADHYSRPARTLDLAAAVTAARRLGSDVRGDYAFAAGTTVAAATRQNSPHAPAPRRPRCGGGRREPYAGHESAARVRSHRRRFIIGSYRPKAMLPCPSGMTLNAGRKCVADFKADFDDV